MRHSYVTGLDRFEGSFVMMLAGKMDLSFGSAWMMIHAVGIATGAREEDDRGTLVERKWLARQHADTQRLATQVLVTLFAGDVPISSKDLLPCPCLDRTKTKKETDFCHSHPSHSMAAWDQGQAHGCSRAAEMTQRCGA